MDFSLPTNNGTTICGKMMISLRGISGTTHVLGFFMEYSPVICGDIVRN